MKLRLLFFKIYTIIKLIGMCVIVKIWYEIVKMTKEIYNCVSQVPFWRFIASCFKVTTSSAQKDGTDDGEESAPVSSDRGFFPSVML